MHNDNVLTQEFIDNCNKQYIEELWTVPWNAYHVANIDGIKIYTSQGLKDRFCLAMEKNARTKKVSKKINLLVENNKIIPAWLNKGIFSLTIFKIFAPIATKSIMGFYTQKADQIFLLMDNNMSFGFSSNKRLSELLVHESMHMASSHLKKSYQRIFEKELTAYYSTLYRKLFEISGNIDKEVKIVYSFLFKEFEYKSVSVGRMNSVITKYTDLLVRLFNTRTGLEFDKFQEILVQYMTMIKLYFTNLNGFISSIRNFIQIYRPMKEAYVEGLKVKNGTSLCIQELIYPSEVISMYSELAKPGSISNVYKAFGGIR
jgi:hypothetical protein